jgi:hypothetical protein
VTLVDYASIITTEIYTHVGTRKLKSVHATTHPERKKFWTPSGDHGISLGSGEVAMKTDEEFVERWGLTFILIVLFLVAVIFWAVIEHNYHGVDNFWKSNSTLILRVAKGKRRSRYITLIACPFTLLPYQRVAVRFWEKDKSAAWLQN